MNKIKGFLLKHGPALILGMAIVASSRPGVHLNVTLSKPEPLCPDKVEPKE